MSEFVLDSSAILAVINLEPGYEVVESVLTNSAVSTVNVCEVLTKLIERGVSRTAALEDFLQLGITVKPFDISNAEKTADLRLKTKRFGLSLGDRACLALAIDGRATAVTADRSWRQLKVCDIKFIR